MDEMFMAEVAYNIQRYEDCLEYLTPLIKNPHNVDMKKLKMWSKCNKMIINKQRSTWLMILKLDDNLDVNNVKKSVYNEYKLCISSNIEHICNGIIQFLDDYLMDTVSNVCYNILIYQIRGDCHRYKAEVCVGETMLANYNKALVEYKSGWKLCLQNTVSVCILLYYAVKYAICLNFIHGPERAMLFIEEALTIATQRHCGENRRANIFIDHTEYKQSYQKNTITN